MSGGTLTVLAGGSVTGATIAGTSLLSGGTDSGSVVSIGGEEIVGSGSLAAGETVDGLQIVQIGGTVSNALITNGEFSLTNGEIVSGGTIVSATLTASGSLLVEDGSTSTDFGQGLASATVVSAGGVVNAVSGGTTISTTLLAGPSGTTTYEAVGYGGSSFATTVNANDLLLVQSGGLAQNSVVNSGGFMNLVGGSASFNTIASGATLSVVSAFVLTTSLGGTEVIGAGGSATTTIVSAGGLQVVFSGGSTTNTIISAGGEQTVLNGGSASVVIMSGGIQVVASGGQVRTTVLASGTQQIVDGGGVAQGDVISNGATVVDQGTLGFSPSAAVASTVAGTVSGGGQIVQSGPGTLKLAGDLSAFRGTIVLSAGTVELTSAGAAGGAALLFAAGGAAELRIDGASGPTNVISGFAYGDGIDLANLGYSSTNSVAVAGNTVTLDEGSASFVLNVAGASFDTFMLANDGNGGTLVSVACYCPGTLIMTPQGARPVEMLAIGDLVTTLEGAERPVKWIGRRSYAGRFLAANPAAMPVRFRAGSLGGGLPLRDLVVSPEHAMFLDGVLVPACCLVNGSSIAHERGLLQIHYHHVELDTHDILLAEGAPSETFIDDDSRQVFHNAAEFSALYPDAAPAAGFYAPRVSHGYELEAIRRRLNGTLAGSACA